MIQSQAEIHAAALAVVQTKLARGVSHIEVEQILGHALPVEVSGMVRNEVHRMFASWLESMTGAAA